MTSDGQWHVGSILHALRRLGLGTIVALFLSITLLSPYEVTCWQSKDELQIKARSAGAQAQTPPRGWNSYDSFDWVITEEQFLQNAKYVSDNLLQYGYEYVVVDYLWYRKDANGATYLYGEDLVDKWGRLQPDPTRWPSSVGGKGFTEVANKVHALGLKFGIHVMRGISLAAVNANTSILGSQGSTAKDIALLNDFCSWMPRSFVGVDTSIPAGRAFISSLYEQYRSWGVDFVKHDCVFGEDLQLDEITTVSSVIGAFDEPMYYSLSPGVGSTTALGGEVGKFVNLYRAVGDTWDSWGDIITHFDVARDFANSSLLGADGLRGLSWPDLDMLPLGYLTTAGSGEGPNRWSDLSSMEQRTLMTLWAIAKSPLFYGGDLRHMDYDTLQLITNDLILEVNSNSYNNKLVEEDVNLKVWAAIGDLGEVYLAVFNVGDNWLSHPSISIQKTLKSINYNFPADIDLCLGTDAWTGSPLLATSGNFVFGIIPPHGSDFISFIC